jgi:hypothetical protein
MGLNGIGSEVQAFASGTAESLNALIDNALPMTVCIGIGSLIGYLHKGTPMAWRAARVTGAICGAIFATERSVFMNPQESLRDRTSYSLGNMVGSAGTPYVLALGVERLLHGRNGLQGL